MVFVWSLRGVGVMLLNRAAKHGDDSWGVLDLIGMGCMLVLGVLSSAFFVTLALPLDSWYNSGHWKGGREGRSSDPR